jgi:uncharacterized damage-inducible protein DinB
MHAADVRRLIDYHYWANNLVWGCVMKLDEEQYTRDLDYSIGSIHRHVVHTLAVEWMWFSVVNGTLAPGQRFSAEGLSNREAIRVRWDALETDVRAYLDSLTDEELNRVIEYEFPWCGKQKHPAWQCLLYIVTHMVDHRAQMLQGIHRMGGETVAQDFIRYIWDHPES